MPLVSPGGALPWTNSWRSFYPKKPSLHQSSSVVEAQTISVLEKQKSART